MKGQKMKDSSPKMVYAGAGSNVVREAEERKMGGRTKMSKMHKKHVGHAEGSEAKERADRKPRKSGGRTGSNMNPLSSAHAGTAPKGRKLEMN
jgi:hypothetical protein